MPPLQVFTLPASAASQGISATMALPQGAITREEIETLVVRTVNNQKGIIMLRLRDRAPHPFTPKIMIVTVFPHIQNLQIDSYRGKADPVEHIQRHEVSLLVRTNDGIHSALLFPSTLGGAASH